MNIILVVVYLNMNKILLSLTQLVVNQSPTIIVIYPTDTLDTETGM